MPGCEGSYPQLIDNLSMEIENLERNRVCSKRKSIPPYQVFFTWDIHYACNYKCSYCILKEEWDALSKKNRYPGINKWIEIWDSIYRKYGSCRLHISGGEPFVYPSFLELIAHLAEKHTLTFDTNLSLDVFSFTKKIKPERVRFAATFHPEFTELASYLERVKHLKENGFEIIVDYVAYPPN